MMDQMSNNSSPKVVKLDRDGDGEAQYVKQIVKTRGEGLSDLLNMKSDFEKYQRKVSNCHVYCSPLKFSSYEIGRENVVTDRRPRRVDLTAS